MKRVPTATRDPDGLTVLERKVGEGLATGLTHLATMRAARPESKATDKSLAGECSLIAKRQHVLDFIQRFREAAGREAARRASVTYERVLEAHAAIAFASVSDLVDEDGRLRFDPRALSPEQAAAFGVELVFETPPPAYPKESQEGAPPTYTSFIPTRVRVKSLDKQKALDEIAALMGWGEKNSSGRSGGSLLPAARTDARDISETEVARRVAFMMRRAGDVTVIEGDSVSVSDGEVVVDEAVVVDGGEKFEEVSNG